MTFGQNLDIEIFILYSILPSYCMLASIYRSPILLSCSEPIGLMSPIPGKIPKLIPGTEIGDRKPNDGIYTIYAFQPVNKV